MIRLIALLAAAGIVLSVASDFWLVQVFARAMILGTMALSLNFLASYLGVVSFAQVTMAGAAGYTLAYFGPNAVGIGVQLPIIVTLVIAMAVAVATGAVIGLIARHSRGIYAIMLTLAIAVAFFYFTRQNYSIFNGWTGFSGLTAPTLFGTSLRNPHAFFILSMLVSLMGLGLVHWILRSPLGLAIQAVRDAPRRVHAIGIPTTPVIVAAFAISGFIAGSAGILNVWLQERISSFSVGLGPIIDVLIISVIGGIRTPAGAFVGAVIFVLLDNFAVDLIDRERFNTLIGLVLLVIVMTAPEGVLGLAKNQLRKLREKNPDFNQQGEI